MYDDYALQTLHSLIDKSCSVVVDDDDDGDGTIQTLLNLVIINPARARRLFTPSLISAIHPLPFTTLLAAKALFPIRKTAHCITCLLHCAPKDLLRLFANDKPFILALAHAYDHGLAAIAHSYGGVNLADNSHWQTLWAESKVALIDSFHVILTTILDDLTRESDHAFDILFDLLELPPSSPSHSPTPFLNRPLLTDYQHAYDLAHSLQHAPTSDPRTLPAVSALRALSSGPPNDPGALSLLLRAPNPGIGKGKARARSHSHSDPELEAKIDQVLDILPDHPRTYIRALLIHPAYPFRGSPDAVVGALLEGTAPAPADLDDTSEALPERANVWDEDVMDVKNLRFGKKIQDEATVLGDRSFIDAMKADILRRADAMSADDVDADSALDTGPVSDDEQHAVRILGDGEASDPDSSAEDPAPPPETLETILELAYIRDPRLFDRDSATRRGRPRADLRAQTGWADEQIEGWRIMLERNPRKDAVLQKHEFAGNRAGPSVVLRGGGGGGAGRGAGRGRGGGDAGSARERAWKDKNKASRGNHARKRGHDRKMARAGAPS